MSFLDLYKSKDGPCVLGGNVTSAGCVEPSDRGDENSLGEHSTSCK